MHSSSQEKTRKSIEYMKTPTDTACGQELAVTDSKQSIVIMVIFGYYYWLCCLSSIIDDGAK